MLWTDTAEGSFLAHHGGVVLAESATFAGLRKVIESQGYLCVELPAPGPAQRGHLSMHIEEAIELTLNRLGALAPGVGASVDVDASISDQLYRARLIERRGIVLFVPNLEGMACLQGTLDAEDSLALSWWMQTTQERPLGLVIESLNRRLNVYPAPVPFETLLRARTYPPPAPATAPDQAQSSDAMELSEAPPRVRLEGGQEASSVPLEGVPPAAPALTTHPMVTLAEEPEEPLELEPGPQKELALAEAPAALALEAANDACADSSPADLAEPEQAPSLEPGANSPAAEATESAVEADAQTVAAEPASEPEADALVSALAQPDADSASVDHALHEARTLQAEAPRELLARARGEKLEPAPDSGLRPAGAARGGASAEDTADPFHRTAQREWPNWVRELQSTRGPKPLAVVERTFVSAYTPLREATIRRIAGPEAEPALRTFASSFNQSYSEAFDALRVRGKRPTMVLDVPEIAHRIGRLHGARSIQLMLVDAMRFDVGLRVQQRLRELSRGEASLAERLLLWSALPTNTATQLELIGKGASGLKEPIGSSETPAVVARGRNAATPRRIKAGPRELVKLDIIEARLADPGKDEPTRLDEIAEEVAQAASEYFDKLPPRTLVMMFGDHGFVLDRLDGGTSAGRSGGARPEEVLVPAFAWLVGSVH